VRFQNFDLNLLVALRALIEERSVTRAAERVGLSQPAMSAALKRLREALGDDILVPNGRAMIPTAHAQMLAPMLDDLLGGMQSLIAAANVFDPATSKRVFRIVASDYITMVLVAPLLAELERDAPQIGIEITPARVGAELKLGRGEIDLMLGPEPFLSPEHPTRLVFEERFVAVGWRGNPRFERGLSERDYLDSGHVVVELGGHSTNFAEFEAQRLGYERRVEVVAPSFLVVPWMLLGTQRIATMHERLARRLITDLPLVIAPLPVAMPPMLEMAQYHAARERDGGLQWLIERLVAQAATLN